MTLVLDAGALIALERRDRRCAVLLARATADRVPVLVTAPVWAQVWRASPQQAMLARLLRAAFAPLVPFDAPAASAVGRLLASTRTADVVDAHVVLTALAHDAVVLTSDAPDLRHLAPALRLAEV